MPQISANNKTDSHDISDILCLTPLSSFQQYFSNIVPVSFIRGGNRSVSIQDQCLTRTMCNHRLLKYNIGINDLLFVTRSLVLCVCFVDRCLFLVGYVLLDLQFYVYVLQIVVCFQCRSCFSIFSFMCMFCRSLFVLFFFWPFCSLSVDLQILTPLVSSNSYLFHEQMLD